MTAANAATPVAVTRHFVDVGARRVHYRRAGSGPALLMIHQSPRSGSELAPLMQQWGRWFTCIAPDTPGFGQSAPLADPNADITAFADALNALVTALGLPQVAAYGFHSGAAILELAARRQPHLYSAVALGGYPVWTDAERTAFAGAYLPPFTPTAYGEHLVWLWNRLLEQSWFFPWYNVRPEARMSVAHADVARVDALARDMLDAGDAYRVGYGAVLQAAAIGAEAASPDFSGPPLLISAYDGDPLQAHIDRIAHLPRQWQTQKVATPAAHQALSLAFLQRHAANAAPAGQLGESAGEGFLRVDGTEIHWRGAGGGDLWLHAPADESVPPASGLAIDLPGHGLSGDGDNFAAVIAGISAQFGCWKVHRPSVPVGDIDALYPDLGADRFGSHLTRAWGVVRARRFFAPWYRPDAAHVTDFTAADIAPARLARAHRALLRARSAPAWHRHLATTE